MEDVNSLIMTDWIFKEVRINVPEDKRKIKVGMISGWTLTAIELWNDKEFIEKRIEEQYQYAASLTSEQLSDRCTRTRERFYELIEAAQSVLENFQNRLKELNSDVAQSGEHFADIEKGNGS